ncbi:23S rRNA (adenine(2503)-C(2))-methyltransferase RlmN [bacterium]|nr:23S rRNA (adenine(2503)-C(2))-methyltransferase RlmN [bacterium]
MLGGMDGGKRVNIWGETPEGLAAWVEAEGEPGYRAGQLLSAVYRHHVARLEDVTGLPRALRGCWSERLDLSLPEIAQKSGGDKEGAVKYLLSLCDGQNIEMVRIRQSYGDTLCISSQVGCALGCRFCATGQMGLRRNLSAAEIVGQVVVAARDAGLPQHLVFMGMGEPLQNYDAIVRAVRILAHPQALGMSPRRMTVSTAGMVPEIYRLAREGLPLTLAVSLGGSNDEIRRRLVPLGCVYRLSDVLAAARAYATMTGRRVTYEYLLLAGATDRRKDAERLAALLARDSCHVNLLRYNVIADLPFRAVSAQVERSFKEWLTQAGIATSIRHSKGERIMAACGQLSRQRSPAPAPPAWAPTGD